MLFLDHQEVLGIEDIVKEVNQIFLPGITNIIAWYSVPISLDTISEKDRSYDLCLEAVRQKGEALQYVPEELKNEELCLAAVKQAWKALYYVPEELKSSEICSMASKQDGRALYYVPGEVMTRKLCLRSLLSMSTQ